MRKGLRGVFVLVMLLLLLPTVALAAEEGENPREITIAYEDEFHDLDTQYPSMTYAWGETSESATWVAPDSSAWSYGVYEAYRAQLSEEEKGYYDILKDGFANPGSPTVSFEGLQKSFVGTVSANYELQGNTWHGTNLTLSDEASERMDQERNHFYAAFLALLHDHPEMPWLNGSFRLSTGLKCSSPSSVVAGLNTYSSTITMTFQSFEVINAPEQTINADNIALFSSNIASAMETIDAAVAADTESSGNYAILRAMSNYLSDLITYNYDDMTSAYDQTAYSALVNYPGGNSRPATDYPQTVCAGYTSSFKLLCDRYGIPCIYVSGFGNGGAHAWNYVQMDDGYWYAADITWNDGDGVGNPDNYKSLKYFLVGSSTECNDAETYGSTHVNSGIWSSSIAICFPYPELSTYAYVDMTITFDPNGGSVTPTGAKPSAVGKLITLPEPTRKGYKFLGWYTAASGGDPVTTETVFSASATIYAHWEALEYEILEGEQLTIWVGEVPQSSQVLLVSYRADGYMVGISKGTSNAEGDWEFPLANKPESAVVKLIFCSNDFKPVGKPLLLK